AAPGAALEATGERRGFGALLAELEELQAAGGHQVDEHDELAVVGREEQTLRTPLGACEPTPLQGRERRIERLQRRDVRGSRLHDRKRGHRIVQLAAPSLPL